MTEEECVGYVSHFFSVDMAKLDQNHRKGLLQPIFLWRLPQSWGACIHSAPGGQEVRMFQLRGDQQFHVEHPLKPLHEETLMIMRSPQAEPDWQLDVAGAVRARLFQALEVMKTGDGLIGFSKSLAGAALRLAKHDQEGALAAAGAWADVKIGMLRYIWQKLPPAAREVEVQGGEGSEAASECRRWLDSSEAGLALVDWCAKAWQAKTLGTALPPKGWEETPVEHTKVAKTSPQDDQLSEGKDSASCFLDALIDGDELHDEHPLGTGLQSVNRTEPGEPLPTDPGSLRLQYENEKKERLRAEHARKVLQQELDTAKQREAQVLNEQAATVIQTAYRVFVAKRIARELRQHGGSEGKWLAIMEANRIKALQMKSEMMGEVNAAKLAQTRAQEAAAALLAERKAQTARLEAELAARLSLERDQFVRLLSDRARALSQRLGALRRTHGDLTDHLRISKNRAQELQKTLTFEKQRLLPSLPPLQSERYIVLPKEPSLLFSPSEREIALPNEPSLSPLPPKEAKNVMTVTTAFSATHSSQLSVIPDDLVDIVQRHPSGWTFGRKADLSEGWFPDWVCGQSQ